MRHLAGRGVHLAEEHLAEVGVPDVAGPIHHHVMRLNSVFRQIVFGDHDLGGFAFRARQNLERIAPALTRAQIDRAEIVGEAAIDLHALVAALFHQPLGATQLWGRGDALVHVALHARQDLHEVVGLVDGPHHSFERVTADAV